MTSVIQCTVRACNALTMRTLLTQATASLKDTQRLAHVCADNLSTGDCIYLTGPMGAGKTTFARFLIQHLTSADETVASPTFPIMLTYKTLRGPMLHVDLWRLTKEEVPELGLEDMLPSHIALIEWPCRLPTQPADPLHITWMMDDDGDKRTLSVRGSDAWHQRLKPHL